MKGLAVVLLFLPFLFTGCAHGTLGNVLYGAASGYSAGASTDIPEEGLSKGFMVGYASSNQANQPANCEETLMLLQDMFTWPKFQNLPDEDKLEIIKSLVTSN